MKIDEKSLINCIENQKEMLSGRRSTNVKLICPDCGHHVNCGETVCSVCGCPDTYFIFSNDETNAPVNEPIDYEEDGYTETHNKEPEDEYYLNDPDPYDPYEDDDVDGSWKSVCNYRYRDNEDECDADTLEYDELDYPDYYWEDIFD